MATATATSTPSRLVGTPFDISAAERGSRVTAYTSNPLLAKQKVQDSFTASPMKSVNLTMNVDNSSPQKKTYVDVLTKSFHRSLNDLSNPETNKFVIEEKDYPKPVLQQNQIAIPRKITQIAGNNPYGDHSLSVLYDIEDSSSDTKLPIRRPLLPGKSETPNSAPIYENTTSTEVIIDWYNITAESLTAGCKLVCNDTMVEMPKGILIHNVIEADPENKVKLGITEQNYYEVNADHQHVGVESFTKCRDSIIATRISQIENMKKNMQFEGYFEPTDEYAFNHEIRVPASESVDISKALSQKFVVTLCFACEMEIMNVS